MTLRTYSPRLGYALVFSACLWTGAAFAAQQPTPEQDAAQQTALQARRAQVLARYQAKQAACMHRFFVNDCLNASRQQERSALAPIDTDLQAIALRARMRAAEDELRRVQANIAAAQATQPDSAQTRQQAAAREAALAEREAQAASAAPRAAEPSFTTPRTAPAAPRLFPVPAPQPVLTPSQRAAQAAKAQADYAARQKDYAKKQAEQKRQDATQRQAAPLPVPSPSAALR